MKNPRRKSDFQLKKETRTRSQQKKKKNRSPIISSSEDGDFPASTEKRKQLIEISDDSDSLSNTRDTRR